MASIDVFFIGFVLGCFTGVVVGLLFRYLRGGGSARAGVFWASAADSSRHP